MLLFFNEVLDHIRFILTQIYAHSGMYCTDKKGVRKMCMEKRKADMLMDELNRKMFGVK